tara:strand:+ start:29865 stop:31277 length:1413 start_codon:yes stop_codon:yes gene_type:complete
MIENNLVWLLDSYKHTHEKQYPDGTEKVYSYFESRHGAEYNKTVFFGLQYILKKWLTLRVTKEMIDEAEPILKAHFFTNPGSFNRTKWDYIVEEHEGRFPIEIKAVPEGTKVDIANVMMTVVNTDDHNCHWVTNALETVLTQIWYPSVVATRSNSIVEKIKEAFKRTSDNGFLAEYYLHDFAQRGVTCMDQAGIGGAAHLINSYGTDTLMSIPFAANYYGADPLKIAFSVDATEHSVMSALGEEGEIQHIRDIIKKFPKGILSVVSDTYDITRLVKIYCTSGKDGLKDEILGRDGKFVVRPDSPRFEGDTPEKQVLWIIQMLWENFSGEINSKGFKVLNSKIGVIYGDSLTEKQIDTCLMSLESFGFSAEGCVYGQGGGLLQKVNRDTQRSAFKCSAQFRDGKWIDICKNPLDKSKASKKGLMKLVNGVDGHETVGLDDPRPDLLETVYLNGVITKEYTFDQVKENARKN